MSTPQKRGAPDEGHPENIDHGQRTPTSARWQAVRRLDVLGPALLVALVWIAAVALWRWIRDEQRPGPPTRRARGARVRADEHGTGRISRTARHAATRVTT